MNSLSKVFVVKIAVTLVVWSVPLVFAPREWIEAAGFPKHESLLFVRMLGLAYLSMCVSYWFGLKASLKGRIEPAAVWVGLLSNGSASACLFCFAILGEWSAWGRLAQTALWASAVVTLVIAVSLCAVGVKPLIKQK